MNTNYYLDTSNLVLLKKENGLTYQYSYTKHFWYSLPNLNGLEQNSDEFRSITEEEANNFINEVDKLIKKANKEKTK